MSIKYVKQFLNWLEAKTNQHTTTKAWSDYIVTSFLNIVDFNCDSKPLPIVDVNPTDLIHNIRY